MENLLSKVVDLLNRIECEGGICDGQHRSSWKETVSLQDAFKEATGMEWYQVQTDQGTCDVCGKPGSEENPIGRRDTCGIETYAHATGCDSDF